MRFYCTNKLSPEYNGLTYEFHAYLQVLLPVNLLVHSAHLPAGLWTISNTPNRQRMLLLLRASTKTQLHSTCLCVLAQQVTNLLFFPSSAGEVSGASYRHCSVFYHLQVAPIDVAASIRHNCFFLDGCSSNSTWHFTDIVHSEYFDLHHQIISHSLLAADVFSPLSYSPLLLS